MSWSRFDDLYDDHPKVMAAMHASPLAVALHATAITAASRRESDGLVDPFWLLARVPDKRKRAEALDTLIDLELYDAITPGDTHERTDASGYTVALGPFGDIRYVVHDYLDYNPSSAQLQDRRRKDAERKSGGRRKDSAGNPEGVQPDISRTPDGPRGSAGAGPQPSPHPIPSHPGTPSSAGAAEPEESREDVARLCHLLANLIRGNDPKAKVAPDAKGWQDAARLLLDRDGRTEADVATVIRWCQADAFWRANILSMPKLREKYAQLLLKMQTTTQRAGGADDPWSTENILAAGRDAA